MSRTATEGELRRGETAAWGTRPEPRRMRLISFRPVTKGSLRGFCNLELPSGLILKEVSVHVSNGKAWAGLPAAPIIDSADKHHVVDGKRQYRPIAEWRDRELSTRFSAAVVELVRTKYPDALDEAQP